MTTSNEPDSGPPAEPADPVTGDSDGSLEEHHEDDSESEQLQLPLAIPVPVLNPQFLPGQNGLTP